MCFCFCSSKPGAGSYQYERFLKQAAVEFKLNADANYAKAMVLAKGITGL
jgi:hypothetical protein